MERAAENTPGDDETKGTTLVEERGPIDPYLDLPAYRENPFRIQQHSTAADVDSGGVALGAIQEIPGADADGEPLMLAAVPQCESLSGVREQIDLFVKLGAGAARRDWNRRHYTSLPEFVSEQHEYTPGKANSSESGGNES